MSRHTPLYACRSQVILRVWSREKQTQRVPCAAVVSTLPRNASLAFHTGTAAAPGAHNSTTKITIMAFRFPLTSAQLNARDSIAIVQPAKTNAVWKQQWDALQARHLQDKKQFLAEYKESGAWREEWKTWGACCEQMLNVSTQYANRLIKEYSELGPSETLVSNSDPTTTTYVKNNCASAQHSEGRSSPVATPKQPTNATNNGSGAERNETAPVAVKNHNNGKPIFALPIWNEIEELYGKALNRVDMLNHLSPNANRHDAMISRTKQDLSELREWRKESK